jgi:hypothetical protein
VAFGHFGLAHNDYYVLCRRDNQCNEVIFMGHRKKIKAKRRDSEAKFDEFTDEKEGARPKCDTYLMLTTPPNNALCAGIRVQMDKTLAILSPCCVKCRLRYDLDKLEID